MKKILFIGAEAMPFAATGGLGDVLGSLPKAIAEAGEGNVDVRVVMPLYRAVSEQYRSIMKTEAEFEVGLAWRTQYCGIKSLVKDGVTYYFIDNEYYFNRDTLYGSFDDGERFAFFSKAAIEMLDKLEYYPDIVHAHDWQSALSVIYLKCKYGTRPQYSKMKTVFTIHNIEYQGIYDFSILSSVFELDWWRNTVEWDGCINLMKGAIVCADKVTTVSPRYADEIRGEEHSHGLSRILNGNACKLYGILNGIDYVYYDPETDDSIAQKFSADSLDGKYANKAALQKEVGLPERNDIPLISIVSRLAAHKGMDIISEMIYALLGNCDSQLVILGKGEPAYERFFRQLENDHPDRVRALITYDRDLAKRIYAASDIFLMPSKSEPCGLSQMIASRYGVIPVTRETGGLYDSIKGYWEDNGEIKGNGFTFANYSSFELGERSAAAITLWNNEDKRIKLIRKIMHTDFSWKSSAIKYIEMYDAL
ncbi:MAG: glycogen synthase GlgA [Clostridia bacterium]|nr:glycogen synthase GlgA [Clostridia bacterium]